MGFGINLGMGLGIGLGSNTLSTPIPFTFSEIINSGGATITETNVGPLTIEVKSTSFQVNPIVDGYIKVNNNTIATTTTGSRGHTLAVLHHLHLSNAPCNYRCHRTPPCILIHPYNGHNSSEK